MELDFRLLYSNLGIVFHDNALVDMPSRIAAVLGIEGPHYTSGRRRLITDTAESPSSRWTAAPISPSTQPL
jgi:hypothetical protein